MKALYPTSPRFCRVSARNGDAEVISLTVACRADPQREHCAQLPAALHHLSNFVYRHYFIAQSSLYLLSIHYRCITVYLLIYLGKYYATTTESGYTTTTVATIATTTAVFPVSTTATVLPTATTTTVPAAFTATSTKGASAKEISSVGVDHRRAHHRYRHRLCRTCARGTIHITNHERSHGTGHKPANPGTDTRCYHSYSNTCAQMDDIPDVQWER